MIELKKYKAILSLTSHGVRVKNILRTLKPIIDQYKNIKIVLTLFKEDYQYLTNEIYQYINNGDIELFVSNIDLGPHLKYFFTATRYKDIPIIIIDDDIIYPDNFITEMLECYEKFPNNILSRRMEKITFNEDGTFLNYKKWLRPYFLDEPTHSSLLTGVGGILFPENFFHLNENNIKELLQKCKYDDDIYLKILSLRQDIKIKSIKSKQMYKVILNDKETQSIALCATNEFRTTNALSKFKDEVQMLKQMCK